MPKHAKYIAIALVVVYVIGAIFTYLKVATKGTDSRKLVALWPYYLATNQGMFARAESGGSYAYEALIGAAREARRSQ